MKHSLMLTRTLASLPALVSLSSLMQPGFIVQHKQIVHVSFVPMTRDAHNDVLMLDPASPDGQALLRIVEKSTTMPLHIEGREVVLVDKTKPADPHLG